MTYFHHHPACRNGFVIAQKLHDRHMFLVEERATLSKTPLDQSLHESEMNALAANVHTHTQIFSTGT